MDTVKQATKVIKAALAILSEEDQEGLKNQGLAADIIINNASGMTNGHEGKDALLKVWAVSEANRIVSFAWRKGVLTEEVEKLYRELETIEEAGKDYEKFLAERKVIADELESKKQTYATAEREMQIFQAVLSGMSKEDAEKEMAAYQQKIQEAMGR